MSFIRALIPFTRAPSSGSNRLSKAPPPSTIHHIGVRVSTYGFQRGHKHAATGHTGLSAMFSWLPCTHRSEAQLSLSSRAPHNDISVSDGLYT